MMAPAHRTRSKRRRLLANATNDSFAAKLPLQLVVSFLGHRRREELLALSAVNKDARAAVEHSFERVYKAILQQQHRAAAADGTFNDRIREQTGIEPVPLPFRYLVPKAMSTHLYELTVDAIFGAPEGFIGPLLLSPLEDRLAVVSYNEFDANFTMFDLNTKKRLSEPLMHHAMRGLFFLDDGRVISCSLSRIFIWTQENGAWINRIVPYGPLTKPIHCSWAIYRQREIIFVESDYGSLKMDIKALDVDDGSVRDMFSINLALEGIDIGRSTTIHIIGDRWLLINFYHPGCYSRHNRGGISVYDVESSQRICFLPGNRVTISHFSGSNCHTQSKFFYIEGNNERFVRALELGDDGRLTQLESFRMRVPFTTIVEAVSENQLFMLNQGRLDAFDVATERIVRTLNGNKGVIAATRNEFLVADSGIGRIRAFCLEEPRL